MAGFETRRLPVRPDLVAPDGSDVRVLLQLAGGSLAHFTLAPGQVSIAVAHRTAEEIWFFLAGRGEMWRRFQFRSLGEEPLAAIAVTMPPWPGEGEAYAVKGRWTATSPENSRRGP